MKRTYRRKIVRHGGREGSHSVLSKGSLRDLELERSQLDYKCFHLLLIVCSSQEKCHSSCLQMINMF